MSKLTRQCYEFDPFRLDPAERLLLRDGQPVPLTPKAFDTLLIFVENSNQLLTKEELIAKLWPDSFVEESNLAQNVSMLRKALGGRPQGGQYIETVPKRGYRFVTEVRLKVEEKTPALIVESVYSPLVVEQTGRETPYVNLDPARLNPVISPDDETVVLAKDFSANHEASISPPQELHRAVPDTSPLTTSPITTPQTRRFRRSPVLLFALLLVITIIGSYLFFFRSSAVFFRDNKPDLAVLPFRNLKPDPSTDFLGFSLADAVITKLNYINSLTVRPSAYVYKYRNQEIEPQRVANELNVDILLTGTFLKEGDNIRINLQLIDLNKNQVLWSDPLSLKYEKLLTIQDHVTQQVIERLSVTLTPDESERIKRGAPKIPLAYEYHLRGVDLYWIDDLRTATKMLEQSVDLDPNYALSWAYLGTVHTTYASLHFGGREYYAKAQQAYDRALRIDPSQIEARIFMAAFLTDTGRVEEAVPLLRGVLQTNSNLAQAHWELAYAYRFGGMIKESIDEGERARQIDDEIKANNSVFNSYLYDLQYDKFLSSLPLGGSSAFVTFYRGFGHYYLNNRQQAQSYFNHAYEMNPSLMPVQVGKALSYAIDGQTEQGLELLRRTEKMITDSGVTDSEGIYKVAQIFAVLGDKPSALRLLRRSIEGGFFCYPYFINDALLANLRGEADYSRLMELARHRHEEFTRKFSVAAR
ncbi:MAG: winged helix-turn-helix domain-containing protein [Acidobacteria bacterium]|nr:winged helix-turn-helix domain-containing protein [Acidobacteriota bacterium]